MSHSETILKRLHDQYLRGLDCDVILTAADHLERNTFNSDVSLNKDIVWKNVSCHKVVLRAASSFFDRIFSNKFTFDKNEVEDGVEGMLVSNNDDDHVSLQIILHKISSHSIQAMMNFAYTGCTEIETNILGRIIEDFKIMNLRDVMDNLETRLDEDLSFSNCVPNLIISYTLEKKQKYQKTALFILEEFFRGFKKSKDCEERWTSVDTESSMWDMNLKVITELKKEASEVAKFVIAEDIFLLNVLIKLVENNYISVDEETKLLDFLISKKREKCSSHLQNIQLYCYTDGQQLCVQCLTNGHVKHHIESIGIAKYNQLKPYWEKVDLELEDVKESAQIRLTEIDDLASLLVREKLRELEIVKNCKEIKPKLDRLSQIFQSGDLESNDTDVLAFEQFIALLEKESKRTKGDYEKAKRIAEDLMIVMQKRCTSCASIVDASLEIETFEDFEEIDLDQPLRIENCISILKRSKEINNQKIYDEAFNFLLKNFINVVKQSGDSFNRRISLSEFENLLKSGKLKVKSEDDVVPIVKNWLEFDYRERIKGSGQLLKHVRYGFVSEKLLKEVKHDPNLMNPDLRKLINSVVVGVWAGSPRDSTFVKVIALGKNGLKATYDSLNGTWEEWHEQNNGELFCAVIVAENVFIMGGRNDSGPLSQVSIYNLRTKTWKSGPNMLEHRYGFAACVTSANAIYLMGGYNAEKKIVNSVEVLQCDVGGEPIGKWQTLPPMKSPRYFFAAAATGDKIYAIGGSPNLATVEVFDPKENSWKYSRALTHGADRHTASVYDGEIYVFGKNGLCEKYNPETDTWTSLAALTTKAEIRGSTVSNGKIYLVGGKDCCEMDIYDVESNTWSKGPQMPKPIGWTSCVS